MENFNNFFKKLVTNTKVITLAGNNKKILGMSRYTTKNMPDGEYLKIVFVDHSLMIVLPSEQEIYYADRSIGRLESVKDEDIGVATTINYLGREFEVVNKQDYQYVIQKYMGAIGDIEGECSFTDYAPIDGSKEMLSLGIISDTHERADVYCKLIPLSNILID